MFFDALIEYQLKKSWNCGVWKESKIANVFSGTLVDTAIAIAPLKTIAIYS